MQRGIDRPFGQVEQSTAPTAKRLSDCIPVRGLSLQSGEQEKIDVTL